MNDNTKNINNKIVPCPFIIRIHNINVQSIHDRYKKNGWYDLLFILHNYYLKYSNILYYFDNLKKKLPLLEKYSQK